MTEWSPLWIEQKEMLPLSSLLWKIFGCVAKMLGVIWEVYVSLIVCAHSLTPVVPIGAHTLRTLLWRTLSSGDLWEDSSHVVIPVVLVHPSGLLFATRTLPTLEYYWGTHAVGDPWGLLSCSPSVCGDSSHFEILFFGRIPPWLCDILWELYIIGRLLLIFCFGWMTHPNVNFS